MSISKIKDMYIIPYTSTIRCRVISSKNLNIIPITQCNIQY